jgi:IMP cyclohydrolase
MRTTRNDLESLSRMTYPGRVIILGKEPSAGGLVAVYAITGRSPSSQARRIIVRENRFLVRPTDEDALKCGDESLLIYPAILLSRVIVVGNGRQTASIRHVEDPDFGAVGILAQGMRSWSFEPDAPNFTPRISGCVTSEERAAFCIVKRGNDGRPLKTYFEFPLSPGRGKMIATYTGENVDPLPSFLGDPLDVRLKESTARRIAESVFDALAPEGDGPDFRVSVACVIMWDRSREAYEKAVINRHERNGHG